MKTRSLLPVLLLAAVAPALLSFTARARVATPAVARAVERPLGDSLVAGVAAPSMPLEASPEASASASPPPPRTLGQTLADSPPPLETSPRPTREEWSTASDIPLDGAPAGCSSKRVREWLRVRCAYSGGQQVALLSGEKKGTTLALWQKSVDWFGDTTQSVVLQLRPGDRRVVAMTSVEMNRYAPATAVTDAILTEQWVEGEPAPLVVLSH